MRTKVRDDLLMETVRQALMSHYNEGDYDTAMAYCEKLMDIATEIGVKVLEKQFGVDIYGDAAKAQ